jgi:hypothetical protein
MTHEDAGHYSAKHAPGSSVDPAVEKAVKEKVSENGITCAAAHKIAAAFSIDPLEVGKALDLMEIRIQKCQLGLFGYKPEKCIIKPAPHVPPALAGSLRNAAPQGRIACNVVWQIADQFGISRLEAAAACEGLDLKITPCQLGAF